MTENQILDSEQIIIQRKPLSIFVLLIYLIGIGGFIGATTNLINVNISEEYFRNVIGWGVSDILMAAVLQGVFEGIIFGVIFSFIFTIGFALITNIKADWKFANRQLKKVIIAIYSFWIIGGVIAIILAFVFPEAYDRIIIAVPKETFPRIKYAWVGGSIWGGMIGGIFSLIFGLINTNREWGEVLPKK